MTALLQLIGMRCSALSAQYEDGGCQLATVEPSFCRELCLGYAISPPFMINEAIGPEFRNCEESGPLEHRASCSRDKGIKRQSWKIVSGQKPLGRKVAVGIEIRAARRLAPFENFQLTRGIPVPTRSSCALPRAKPALLLNFVRALLFFSSTVVQITPPVEACVKDSQRLFVGFRYKRVNILKPGRILHID